jgi:translocation and assembly module TamA
LSCHGKYFITLDFMYLTNRLLPVSIMLARPWLALCLLLLGVLGGASRDSLADAAPRTPALDYKVVIAAPDGLKSLLEKNLDLLRWRGNARLDRQQLQRLITLAPEQMKALLATEGYYTPQIDASVEQSASPWMIRFEVRQGEPMQVGSVDLDLQGFDDSAATAGRYDTAALRAGWGLKPGAVFRHADWEAAKRALLRRIAVGRYPRAQLLDSRADVDLDHQHAALSLVIASGPAVRFGALRIEGLQRYPASIIHNLNTLKAGDYYSEAALLDLQARLQDTNYFSSVLVSAQLREESIAAPDTAGMAAPIVVRVIENKSKKVDAGIGYSTNTGNRLQLNYEDLSVFGLKLKSGLTLETKKQGAHADFLFPVTPKGYNDSIGGSFERSDIAGEVSSISTLVMQRNWGSQQVARNLTLEYLTEGRSVVGLPFSNSKSLPLTYGITWRHLDDLLFPTKGSVLNVKIGGAPLPLFTDQVFVRGSAKALYYLPLNAKNRLVLRAEVGALASKSKSGIPDTYLFQAGGDQSVRGYAYQSLGETVGSAVVGARYLATGSVEYQYWFLPTWGAAAFYDVGNAADDLPKFAPKSGYGAGARWKSPVGLVNFDLAYGRAVRQYRLHFSLGFTF